MRILSFLDFVLFCFVFCLEIFYGTFLNPNHSLFGINIIINFCANLECVCSKNGRFSNILEKVKSKTYFFKYVSISVWIPFSSEIETPLALCLFSDNCSLKIEDVMDLLDGFKRRLVHNFCRFFHRIKAFELKGNRSYKQGWQLMGFL